MIDEYLQVTTTTESGEQARAMARSVVEARLAACVQVLGPIDSTYWWNGEIETVQEWMCLMKTTVTRFVTLAAHIKERHTYETPEITATPISHGGQDYLDWISSETKDPARP
jgi:periplasmic divalent cation tolerance protein